MSNFFEKLSTEEQDTFINELSENLQELSVVINKSIKEYKDSYRVYVEAVNKARINGWTIPVHWQMSFQLYKRLASMKDDELSSFYMSEFSKDNREQLYRELKYFSEFIPIGYGKEVEKIIQLLKDDFSNYSVVIPTLYSFLDMICTEMVFGHLNHKEYMKNSVLLDFQENNPEIERDDIKAFTSIVLENLIELLLEQIKYRSFEEEPIFNRNYVMHGRFNPSNYTEKMFYQLVLLCSTTAVFVNDEKGRAEYLEGRKKKNS